MNLCLSRQRKEDTEDTADKKTNQCVSLRVERQGIGKRVAITNEQQHKWNGRTEITQHAEMQHPPVRGNLGRKRYVRVYLTNVRQRDYTQLRVRAQTLVPVSAGHRKGE